MGVVEHSLQRLHVLRLRNHIDGVAHAVAFRSILGHGVGPAQLRVEQLQALAPSYLVVYVAAVAEFLAEEMLGRVELAHLQIIASALVVEYLAARTYLT